MEWQGGNPDAALDLLELWNAVDGSASASSSAVEDGPGWNAAASEEVMKPLQRSAARHLLDETADLVPDRGSFTTPSSPAPGASTALPQQQQHQPLPSLAEAARIASTRKQTQQLASHRRTQTTAATILKQDAHLNLLASSKSNPAQTAARLARENIVAAQMAEAQVLGRAVVLPASAATVQQLAQWDELEAHDWMDEDAPPPLLGGGEDGVLSLAARRQRALERLEYASRMEAEYREKRREALYKASSAFRGGGGGGAGPRSANTGAVVAPPSRDRAEIPGSATYFGVPEQEPIVLRPPTSAEDTVRLASFAPLSSGGGSSLAPSSTKALRGHAAWYYADEARRLDAKARSWGLKAAQALVEERKLAHAALHHRSSRAPALVAGGGGGLRAAPMLGERERNVIDLHLLTTAEALAVVKEEIDKWWWSTPRGASSSALAPSRLQQHSSSASAQRSSAAGSGSYIGFGPGPLYIITGIGKHSRGNVAVLRPAVCGWLKRNGWEFEEDAPRGRIVVKGFRGVRST
ncbi:hypothetical protein V8E36_007473 [Tilletia maclaganii]